MSSIGSIYCFIGEQSCFCYNFMDVQKFPVSNWLHYQKRVGKKPRSLFTHGNSLSLRPCIRNITLAIQNAIYRSIIEFYVEECEKITKKKTGITYDKT